MSAALNRIPPDLQQDRRGPGCPESMKLFECQNCGQPLYFENTSLRELRPAAGLLAGTRNRHRAGSGTGRWLVAGAGRAGGALSVLRQCRAQRLQLAGACRCSRAYFAPPAVTTAPFPISRSPKTSRIGARSSSPSTGCSIRCCGFACRSTTRTEDPERPRLRFPVEPGRRLSGRSAGDDRARQRPHHPQRGGGRRSRARTPAQIDGRALSHAARPFPARDRALLLGPPGGGFAGDRRVPAAVRRRARGLRGGAAAPLRQRPGAPTGRSASSPPMPARIPGRISPRPGRTIFTWSTRWRPRPRSGCGCGRRWPKAPTLSAAIDFDPYVAEMDRIIDAWLPLTFAVNSINRSMGQPDLYPFVLPPPVIWKLTFIHNQIHAVSSRPPERLPATTPCVPSSPDSNDPLERRNRQADWCPRQPCRWAAAGVRSAGRSCAPGGARLINAHPLLKMLASRCQRRVGRSCVPCPVRRGPRIGNGSRPRCGRAPPRRHRSRTLVQRCVTPGAVELVMVTSGMSARAEHRLDHRGDGGAADAVCARIFGVHRRVVDRLPGGVEFGCRVVVDVAVADRRDRAPEVVVIFRVEYRDIGVGDRGRRQRHEPRAVDERSSSLPQPVGARSDSRLRPGDEPEGRVFGLPRGTLGCWPCRQAP